jgi:hypothetical protein
MVRFPLLPSILLCVSFVACGCAETAGFRVDGFRAENAAYSVAYLDASSGRLLPREWNLDNYFLGEDGKPSSQKDDGLYRRKVEWILPDGSSMRVGLVVHDLKFLHNSGAVLSVRRVPVPFHMQTMNLSAVAEEWANSNNGTLVEFSFDSTLLARRSASKLIDSQARTISGHPAREVTFELVDVDQLQFNPQAPRTRIRALFIQAPIVKQLNSMQMIGDVPAVLLVAYAHDAQKFDKLVPDYESLVSRIRIPQ